MRIAMLLGLGLGLLLAPLPAPAAAQVPIITPAEPAPAIPRTYPTNSALRASTNPPPEEAARDAAAAAAAEAACDAGALAGCTALGQAYENGAGRPQNRPVAELLYRQACDGAEGEGCLRLGELLGQLGDPASRSEGALFFARACRVGHLPGCDAEADARAAGLFGVSDPEGAEALRRATCAADHAPACVALGRALIRPERSPAEQAEGGALIHRLCAARDQTACAEAIIFWRAAQGEDGPETRRYHELACQAESANSCTTLGNAALALGPPGQAEAVYHYERACAIASYYCQDAAEIRAEPALAARCDAGAQDACAALGAALARYGSPLRHPTRAVRLLGPACDAGQTAACLGAAQLTIELWDRTIAPDPARLDAYLAASCAAASADACELLADELARGDRLTPDPVRAGALYVPQCEAGRASACRFLEELAVTNPAAPLMLASAEFGPDLTEAERSEQARLWQEAELREQEADRERACTTTTVTFRGVTYTDTLCSSVVAVRNSFAVRSGAAPWQALIWRPERVARGRRVAPEKRVLCGGSVIRDGWVLTAAHCLNDPAAGPIKTSGHTIRLGLANPLVNEGFTYPILEVYKHPEFDPETFAFDIALIRYDPRAGERGSTAYPVTRIRMDPQPFARRPIRAGMPAYVFGWGRTELTGGKPPDRLRAGRLELTDAAACTDLTAFRDHRLGSVLCAAGRKGEQACFGDSGGPLISYAEPDEVPTIIGVVSAGAKCGTTGKPSRYTRIAHDRVQIWLNKTLPRSRAP